MESNQKMSKKLLLFFRSRAKCSRSLSLSLLLSRSRSCSLSFFLSLSLLSCYWTKRGGNNEQTNKRAIKQASFLSDTHLLFSPPNMQAQVVALGSTSPASAPQALNRCRHRHRRHQHLEGAPQCGSQCRQRRRRVPCQSCPEGSPARAAREWLHPPL